MKSEIALIIGGRVHDVNEQYMQGVDIYEEVSILETIVLAKKLEKDGIKAIITSASAAVALKDMVEIPVVKAPHTLFDIMETIIECEKVHNQDQQTIILFIHKSKEVDLARLKKIAKSKLEVFYFEEIYDVDAITKVRADDERVIVIGGESSRFYADKLGYPFWALNFGKETISSAIETARAVLRAVENAQEGTSRMHTILNLFNRGIIITDSSGYINNCNKRAAERLGVDKEKIIGKKIEDITDDMSWITSYVNGISFLRQMRAYRGKNYFVSDYPIILEDGRLIGSVISFEGVDEVEELESKLQQLNIAGLNRQQIKSAGLLAKNNFDDILGVSTPIKQAIEQAKAYAKVDSTILIYGETGSGKELFAQSIHNHSERRSGPFVAINCAALPENLLESELMGYEEGAFTGSKKGGKMGLAELANKGTLFLDEINHIPLSIQARLLRLVQEKQVMRLGGEKVIPVDVRILSATNEDLHQLVKQKRFREDLFYRLNILEVTVPALRERKEDIVGLLNLFMSGFLAKYGKVPTLHKGSLEKLKKYDWPGNIRELQAFTERYVILTNNGLMQQDEFVNSYISKAEIKPADMLTAATLGMDGRRKITVSVDTLYNMEKELIDAVLQITGGNKLKAAARLGISRTSLWKKLSEDN